MPSHCHSGLNGLLIFMKTEPTEQNMLENITSKKKITARLLKQSCAHFSSDVTEVE